MTEVVANIESRVTYEEYRRLLDEKMGKADIEFHLQDRVTFDDLNHYLQNN